MKHRMWNRYYAWLFDWPWIKCPVCGRMFGGHEWENDPFIEKSTIPVIIKKNFNEGLKICPDCTKLGVGDRAWEKAQKEFELSCAESWEAKRTV